MKKKILAIVSMLVIASSVMVPAASASPLTQFGAKCTQNANDRILLFPPWYKGLDCDAKGHPTANELNDLWVVALNIIEWFIIAASYLAVAFIAWGGFKYIKSRGEPGKLAEAKTAILQAIIGLGVALVSVAIVEFVTGVIQT